MDMIKNKPFLTDEKVDDFTAEDFVFVHRNEELLDEAYTATSYAKDVWMHFKRIKVRCSVPSLSLQSFYWLSLDR